MPRERCPVWEHEARGQDTVLKFLHLCDNLRRIHQEAACGVVSEDREVRREGLGAFLLRSGA